MGVAVFAFIVIFLLIGSAGLILFYREAMLQRIASVTSGRGERKPKGIVSTIHQTGLSLSVVVEQFEKVMPKNERDISSARQKLIRAGFRGESAIKILQGSKLFVPVVLCAILLATGAWRFSSFLFLVAAGIGYLAPDMWLRRQVVLRQRRIRRGLPDVLDLMIICVEAGLSLDQATIRTSQELRLAQPDLSDELGVVVLEQAAGKPRAEAWKGLADRTDVDSIRNLVSVLVQAEKFGTSIARTLRIHSDTLRTERRQQIEEQAAKTTVKLVFPLVLFIFPSIFLVTLGPAMIKMSQFFHNFK